jgi:flavin-binding protein dodecin
MNELQVAMTNYVDAAPVADIVPAHVAPVEFVGSSDHTIGEAVRRALNRASRSLRTLEGVGVVVIPQIEGRGAGPRFQVTLRISQTAAVHASQS